MEICNHLGHFFFLKFDFPFQEEALEEGQRYKVGKFVIEKAKMKKSSEL
jgi:hypothetical protein